MRREIGNGCMKPNNVDYPPCLKATPGPQGQPDVMGYHTGKELPIHWKYARTFTLHDRMFAPTDSWTSRRTCSRSRPGRRPARTSMTR